MKPIFYSLLAVLFAVSACKSDATSVGPDEQVAITIDSTSTGYPELPKVSGFNYLIDCDSTVLETKTLTDPESGDAYRYAVLSCMTNKSYELILLDKEGHTLASEFSTAEDVLEKGRKAAFENMLPYAFLIPTMVSKDIKTGELNVETFYPANVTVYRYDNQNWNRLGTERVDSETAFKTLQWNVIHDQPLAYD